MLDPSCGCFARMPWRIDRSTPMGQVLKPAEAKACRKLPLVRVLAGWLHGPGGDQSLLVGVLQACHAAWGDDSVWWGRITLIYMADPPAVVVRQGASL